METAFQRHGCRTKNFSGTWLYRFKRESGELIRLRVEELVTVCDGTLYNSQKGSTLFDGVSIDSRSVSPGALFIAIKGEKNDGHDFISQAIESGAGSLLVQYDYPLINQIPGNVPYVAVKDSHQAMLTLAKNYRDSLDAEFTAITGSNGKTTTKELTYCLLSAVEEKSYRSPGNLNNLFGVPLSLFAVESDAKACILELGISTKNEMPQLAQLVNPDVVLFTNIGSSHLQYLTSKEDVAKAKLELVKNAKADVKVILNADDQVLVSEAKNIRESFITFGLDKDADFMIDSINQNTDGSTTVVIENNRFHLPLVGKHQVYNLLAAYAIVRTLGYSFFEVDTEKINLATAPMRGQMQKVNNFIIITDYYNANPESMKAGLEAFFNMPNENRRVLILGDMLELGKKETAYHQEVGEFLSDKKYDILITVGKLAKEIAKNCNQQAGSIVQYTDKNEATSDILNYLKPNDFIYMKASRGIGLENIYDVLQHQREDT
ncbi:MAG: UDP-N-acetylmuramoyl-tripeptide--D-alanyl-D-alanine ligase [Calditrichaeota bacterium]|nr:MAG: UDP-N-acetylmuramoyl-tripeptide--D-alanyl-D-alanine ligase [Calditrichota bacterium]